MPRPFPADPQAGDGQTDTPAADDDAVDLAKVVLQESGRPDRVPVAMSPRIGVDDLLQQGVDNAEGRRRSSVSRSVLQASPQALIGALSEAQHPVVDGLPADEQALSDLVHGLAVIEPQQGLRSGEFFGSRHRAKDSGEGPALVGSELKGNHGATSLRWSNRNSRSVVKELFATYLAANLSPVAPAMEMSAQKGPTPGRFERAIWTHRSTLR
jgi:hypothetical protein